MNYMFAVFIVEALCVVGVISDYFLKVAGQGQMFIEYRPLIIGIFLQAIAGLGWFIAFKYLTVVQVGVLFGVSNVLLLTLLGVFVFGETIGVREITGIGFAIFSILLMAKFA